MKSILLAALLLGTAAPSAAQAVRDAPAAKEPKAAQKAGDAKTGPMDMKQLVTMFEKIFPPQPEPPAQRLALSRHTAAGIFPNGTYARLFDEMMSGFVDRILAINPADFEPGSKKAKAADGTSLRATLAKEDPHFDERMRIARKVIGEELVKVSALLEPKLRDGLARSIARRFDERQLADINAFLATDSGRAFGTQSMQMWVDPDVMRSMFTAMPDLVAAMPGAVMRLEKETAHLPKPKKKEGGKAKGKAKESEEDEAEADLPAA